MVKTEENVYTKNIKTLIENNIVGNKIRNIQKENDKLVTYWNIGKEIVKAQNEDKIKYGNSYIKELSVELTKLYVKGYDYSNLQRMKKMYMYFPNIGPLAQHFITWTHIVCILPIKNENKRNYYINLVNKNNLSKRQLKEEIKNNAYERLDDKSKDNIVIISKNETMNIMDFIKDPLLLDLQELKEKELNEKALKQAILRQIEKFLLELGVGFSFMGSEKKLKVGNKFHYIDLLFFNVEMDCYVVIELKVKDLQKEDIGQLQFYINYIDLEIKKPHHRPTIGILICKKNDKNIQKYLNTNNIKITTYKHRKQKHEKICKKSHNCRIKDDKILIKVTLN